MKIESLLFLFKRDLLKVIAELNSYQNEEDLWETLPGTTNTGGNLAQHLIGNLKTFIGKPFGKIDYVRDRDSEFNARLFTRQQLTETLDQVAAIIEVSITAVQDQLNEKYPESIKTIDLENQSVEDMIVYLFGHLSYHLGQINYHRRYMNSKRS